MKGEQIEEARSLWADRTNVVRSIEAIQKHSAQVVSIQTHVAGDMYLILCNDSTLVLVEAALKHKLALLESALYALDVMED